MKLKVFTFTLLMFSILSVAQLSDYNYQRSLETVTDDWHSITIPDAVFGKVNRSLSDLRIFGITKNNDTIEAPYILKINDDKLSQEQQSFEILNTSKTSKGHYVTFKVNELAIINNIQLSFTNRNFDWILDLEGSQNQTEWFTVLEDYRILSIKNESSEYSFTKLVFPDARYQYYRVLIKSDTQPKLEKAQIFKQTLIEGDYKIYQTQRTEISNDAAKKVTIINFELEHKVPVQYMKINVNADYDYSRQVAIEYLADSVNTEKGWRYNYKSIDTDYLTPYEDNVSKFNTVAQKFRVTIYNGDNQPLNIESIVVKGFTYELLARFNEPANYVLAYGNTQAPQANYDIAQFKNNIPQQLQPLILGAAVAIEKKDKEITSPLFENELWLWVIMGIVILLLGGFTLKMLQKTEQ